MIHLRSPFVTAASLILCLLGLAGTQACAWKSVELSSPTSTSPVHVIPIPSSSSAPARIEATPSPVPTHLSAAYNTEVFHGIEYPYALGFDGEYIWVTHFEDSTVSKLAQNGEVVATVPVGKQPRTILFAAGYVWVGNGGESTITKIEPTTPTVLDTYVIGGGFSAPVDIKYDGTYLWVTGSWGNSVYQVSLDGKVLKQIAMPGGHPSPWNSLLIGDRIWVANLNIPQVIEYTMNGELVGRYSISTAPPVQEDTPGRGGEGPMALASDGTNVWVAVNWLNKLIELNRRGEIVREITVGRWPYALAFDGHYVWCVNFSSRELSRVDVLTGQVGALPLGDSPTSVVIAGNAIWVANSGDDTLMKMTPK